MNLAPVQDSETLVRFITSSRWFRPGDETVRPDAFIPHPYPDLSVTRHNGLSEPQIWEIGQRIVDVQPQRPNLHGRADVNAGRVRETHLEIEPQPEATNPNHAIIVGWPSDKPSQKSLAQQLAVAAQFKRKPVSTPPT
jgi:hypothetical protein